MRSPSASFARLRWALTLRCAEASRLLSEANERPLSRLERNAVRGHLLVCRGCRAARRQIATLRAAARDLGDGLGDATLSPAARERIAAAIRAESDGESTP